MSNDLPDGLVLDPVPGEDAGLPPGLVLDPPATPRLSLTFAHPQLRNRFQDAGSPSPVDYLKTLNVVPADEANRDVLNRIIHLESRGNPKAVNTVTPGGKDSGAFQFNVKNAARFGVDETSPPEAQVRAAEQRLAELERELPLSPALSQEDRARVLATGWLAPTLTRQALLAAGHNTASPPVQEAALPAGLMLDPVTPPPATDRKAVAAQTLNSYKSSSIGLRDALKKAAYDFTIGPFEEAGKVFGQPFEEHRQALVKMSPEQMRAYLTSKPPTAIEKLMAPPGTYSDEELTDAMMPLVNLGLMGSLSSKSVGGVKTGRGTGFFRRADTAPTPDAAPVPPPTPPLDPIELARNTANDLRAQAIEEALTADERLRQSAQGRQLLQQELAQRQAEGQATGPTAPPSPEVTQIATLMERLLPSTTELHAGLSKQDLQDFLSRFTPSLGKAAQEVPVEPPVMRNYSDVLAAKNRVRPLLPGGYHGMNQVADAAPASAEAFRRASASTKAWEYDVADAMHEMDTTLGVGTSDRFTATMSESQLRGSMKRWADLANELRSADPHDVPDIYRERAGDALNNVGETAFKAGEQIKARFDAATTETGKLRIATELQQYLAKTFQNASQRVTHILDEPTYQAQLTNPVFQRALSIWKDTVGNDLTAAHVQNNGHLLRPEYLGDVGEYFPLIGKAASELAEAGLRGKRPGGPYSTPGNPLNFWRTGLSPEYDLSLPAIQRRIGSSGWASDHATAIAQAEADGLVQKIPAGTPASKIPKTYEYNGVTYRAERVGDHVMPSWVRDEIGPIFEPFRNPGDPAGLLGKTANAIVKTNVKLGVDKAFHYLNETGLLTSESPTLGQTAMGRTLGSLPGIKTAQALKTLFNEITPAQRPVVRTMVRNGEWLPRLDPEAGTLMAMSRRDLAGRLAQREAILRWKPDATPQQLYEASTHFGEYNPQLAPDLIRAIKSSPTFSPVAPFVTAGNAFVRNALRTLTAQGPTGVGGRVVAALTGGVPAAVGAWVAVHLGMTGKVPDPTDLDFKVGQVPYGDTPDGRTKYLNVGRLVSPLGMRGFRVSGITSFLETLARDGTNRQAVESAMGDLVNAQLHPLTGPAVKVGTRLLAGVDPQAIFRMGGVGVRRAHEPTDDLLEQTLANARSALEAVNPLAEKLAVPIEEAAGVRGGPDPTEGLDPVEQILQGLGVVSVSDNLRQAKRLNIERKQMRNAAKKAVARED